MDEPRSKVPLLAIGAAIVALVTSIVAVGLLLARPPVSQPLPATGSAGSNEGEGSALPAAASGIVEAEIAATAVLALKQRENIDDAADGVEVTDDKLRTALKLLPDDIITALNGRKVGRELDIYDAMMGLTMAETTAVYVDLLRDGKPLLVRWKLDVSMRSAWRSSMTLGSSPFGSPSPAPSPAADPAIVASVKAIDDTRYEAPRDAVAALFGSSTGAARIIPSIRNGVPNGVKLYAIRPTSIYKAFGIENGDTILSINGDKTTSTDQLAEAYREHEHARALEVAIERRGRPLTITITVK